PGGIEDGRKRARGAASDELEIAVRDLEARHVARAAHTEHLLLERAERTVIARLHGSRFFRHAGTLPESARGVEHVEVRELASVPRRAVKEVPRLEHRRIERFTVEAYESAQSCDHGDYFFTEMQLAGDH